MSHELCRKTYLGLSQVAVLFQLASRFCKSW